ncbi:MAG: hypothetical protein HY465_03645 [Deltaproteobacteria bacterium]|nr:hypothetical protein [Deltaproteobacteria bacterium]
MATGSTPVGLVPPPFQRPCPCDEEPCGPDHDDELSGAPLKGREFLHHIERGCASCQDEESPPVVLAGWELPVTVGFIDAIVSLGTAAYHLARRLLRKKAKAPLSFPEAERRALPPSSSLPHRDVVVAQFDGLADESNSVVREVGERFRSLAHEPDGTLVRAYLVDRALRRWHHLPDGERERRIAHDPHVVDHALPRTFINDFLIQHLGHDGVPPSILRASAHVWGRGQGIVPAVAEGATDVGAPSPGAPRLPTPMPLANGVMNGGEVTPDPEPVRAQLDDLVNSRDPRLQEAGQRFRDFDPRSRDYLIELAIHLWYYHPDQASFIAASNGGTALLREVVPKSFVKWFAYTYLTEPGMTPAIREAAESWVRFGVPPTRRSRHEPATANEFTPRLEAVRLQLTRQDEISRLPFDVQTYLARVAIDRWYSIPATEQATFVTMVDEPVRGILPYHFVERLGQQWPELEADIVGHAIIHGRLLALFPEWSGVRFAVTRDRAIEVWEALIHVPGFGPEWLIDPQNADLLRELLQPFGKIGTGMRPLTTPDPNPWSLAGEAAPTTDYRGFLLPRVMEDLAEVNPDLRRYPDILAKRAMSLIDDWQAMGETTRRLFVTEVAPGEGMLPQNYISFWHAASPRVGMGERLPLVTGDPSRRPTPSFPFGRRRNRNEEGSTYVGMITGADVAVWMGEVFGAVRPVTRGESPDVARAVATAREATQTIGNAMPRVGVRIGLGGIPFAIGEYASNAILGHPDPPITHLVRSYGALAVGGGVGQVTVDSALHLAGVGASADFSHRLARRTFPLFLALTVHDVAVRRHVAWKELPLAAADVTIASGITVGLGSAVTEAKMTWRIARGLRAVRILSALAAPETLGSSLAVSAIAATTEFTILKGLGKIEERWLSELHEDKLRAEYAEAVRINNELLRMARSGKDVLLESVLRAEKKLLTAEETYLAFLRGKVELLEEGWRAKRRELDREESEWLLKPLSGTRSRHEVREAMASRRDELDRDYREKIAAIEGKKESPVHHLPVINTTGELSSFQKAMLIPARFLVDDRMAQGAREGAALTNVRGDLERHMARTVAGLEVQRASYHQRRNAAWVHLFQEQQRRTPCACRFSTTPYSRGG